MEILEAFTKLAERDPLSLVIALVLVIYWFSQRNSERDDKNVGAALTLTTTMVTTFTQFGEAMQQHGRTMEKIGEAMTEVVAIARSGKDERDALAAKLDGATQTMLDVTARRDREAQQDRDHHTAQHQEIIARLAGLQAQMDDVAKNITILTDLPTMRQESTKLLLLASEISKNVKRLLPPDHPEPGEGAPEVPESTGEASNETEKDKENVATTT